MAFYHADGFIPSYRFAGTFAGDNGRVATMPDIWDIRLATLEKALKVDWRYIRTPPECAPWEQYFTTMSAEYCGLSRAGNPIIIVAHGIGPMRDLDHVVKAYRYQFRDKERNIRGGLIERDEFLRLESGEYGDVHVIDLTAYRRRYQYAFISDVSYDEAMTDPLLKARLGPRWEECIEAQQAISQKWHEENSEEEEQRLMNWSVTNPRPPKILGAKNNMNFSYILLDKHRDSFEEMTPDGSYAMAHLLSMGGIGVLRYSGNDADYPGVVSETSCHSWYDGTRMVGIRAGAGPRDIHPGPADMDMRIRRKWKKIGVKVGARDTAPRVRVFSRLTDDREFATYLTDDKVMQSGEPEFKVVSAKELGVADFTTRVEGYHGLYRFDPADVRRIAPPNANAFVIHEPQIDWEDGNPVSHSAQVTFYDAVVDTALRIPRVREVMKNYKLMMYLLKD